MNELGIFARIISKPTLLELFQTISDYGFETTHFNLQCTGMQSMPDAIPGNIVEDIRLAQKISGIHICGVSGTFNMCHPNIKVREDGLRRLKVIAGFCKEVNINLISLCTGTRDPYNKWKYHPENESEEAWNDMVKCMEQAIKIAETYHLYLGIEPEMSNIVSSVNKAESLLSAFSSDNLKIIIDPANLFEDPSTANIKDIIDEAIDRLGINAIMAHAKDRSEQGITTTPGKGIISFDYFIHRLKESNTQIPIIAHGFPESDAIFVHRYLKSLL